MKPWLALAAFAAAAHAAPDADLARCRAVADDARRLACYDALVAPSPPPPAAAPLATAPAAAASAAAMFGFESRIAQQTGETIESRIPGLFEGWVPNQRIRLENGQVWQVIDDSRGVMSVRDVKVRVTRAAMGTFFLEIEGRRAAPRVRRVE